MEVQMEPDKVSDGAWYPDEYYLFDRIPLARFLSAFVWYYAVVIGGISFIVDYVCTTGMRTSFWCAVIFPTIFLHYVLFCRQPKPLTYTWAKMNGLGTMGCVLYSIYNATVAAITVFVVVFGALISILPWQDMWEWNC